MASKGRFQIVLVPFPLQGHLTPMLQLGTILHSRGFSIIVAHTEYSAPNSSNHPDFIFLPLRDNMPPGSISDIVAFTERLNDNCKPQLQDYLADTTERSHQDNNPDDYNHHQNKIACIIHDQYMYFAEDVAQMLKLPSIVLYTGSAISVLAFKYLPRLHTQGLLPVKEEDLTLDDLVPELQPLRYKDLPIFVHGNLILDVTLKLVEIVFRRPSAVILNTTDHLEHAALQQLHQLHHQVPSFAIGPFHEIAPTLSTSLLTEDRTCISWLDKQVPKSVIYISLGSLTFMEEKDFTEMAWGLANSNQPFLWVVRPGSVLGSEWTELLPDKYIETVGERGCIVKWAPQREVLAHEAVGGFWSHCGWNSTFESICEGVPMLCWPRFYDQTVHARYAAYVWCIGVEMAQELERGEIERAIKRLMVEEEGLEISQKSAELKEKVEASMREGGSSSDSLNELVEYIVSFEHLIDAKPENQELSSTGLNEAD